MDIFRPYSRPNPFRGVQICPYPSPDSQHPIPYPYPNTKIAYLWCRHPFVSYPAWLILSVLESEFDQKYENKCNISDIRPYLIRFHRYCTWGKISKSYTRREGERMLWESRTRVGRVPQLLWRARWDLGTRREGSINISCIKHSTVHPGGGEVPPRRWTGWGREGGTAGAAMPWRKAVYQCCNFSLSSATGQADLLQDFPVSSGLLLELTD